MNPLEALGWVLVVFILAFGIIIGLFMTAGAFRAYRQHGTTRARCGAVGPYGMACQRGPHPTEPAAHAAIDDIDDETARLVKW